MPDPTIADGLIVTTDNSCIISRKTWPGIPTLLWPEGIDEAASDWFRYVVIRDGCAPSTAHEYANILRPFLRFCRRNKRAWRSVNDDFLILWREHLHRGEKISKARVNSVLKTIFAFYMWAEQTNRVRYQVGVYVDDELPAALAGYVFPISAKRVFFKGRSGMVFGRWTTPLTLKDPERGRMRHTPNEAEIRKLHEIAAERIHGHRDSLIMSYAEETGARRSELLQIRKSQMPSYDEIAGLIERDEPWVVMVTRKRNGPMSLPLQPDLLVRTLDFITYERDKVVSHFLGLDVGYREPDEIFISGTSGLPLHPDSVSAMGRRVFGQARVKNASIHRLRARFAVRVIEELVEAVSDGRTLEPQSNLAETILTKAAEIMGHASAQSLRPYLTYVLNRRIQTSDAHKAGRLAERIRQLKLHADEYSRRLSENKALHSVALDLADGQSVRAILKMRKLAEEIEVRILL